MSFDKAGREMAEEYATTKGPGLKLHSSIKEEDFLAGRESCKEALRVAGEALRFVIKRHDLTFTDAKTAEEIMEKASDALSFLKAAGCYVGEE